ncbi:glycosidase [Spirochaetia bacterium]|nr:glycosidase [Spirochaetia bacterium]
MQVTHLGKPNLRPDYARLVIRPFVPTAERIRAIIDRISAMGEEEIHQELEQVISLFSADHGDFVERLKEHYRMAQKDLDEEPDLSPEHPASPAERRVLLPAEARLLAGAYFTSEYAFEATALFNPSIVQAPVQTSTAELHAESLHTESLHAAELRFILSARSVGEGHVSSISFRTGLVNAAGEVHIDPVRKTAIPGKMESGKGITKIRFRKETPISERLLFPVSPDEQNGMEDARFVRFVNDDLTICYYATYTAYDGKNIFPKMIETTDFLQFNMRNITGSMALNKGMALFPRKIKGRYAMLSRMDGESLYIMFSDDLHAWNEAEKIAAPVFPWEFMQIGNCGSPIELDEGWLVLTHGVGSLRRYSIGALLLDKNDPAKLIGRLPEPLLSPGERERTGYVPNVVYTCGSIVHEGRLIIPYGSADFSIAFITVELEELMKELKLSIV